MKKTPAKKKTIKKSPVKKESTAVANTPKAPWTNKQVKLITNTVAKGASIDELHLFLYTANKVGLDPLAKQIHFTKYRTRDGDQMAVITGIDGYRAIAERSGTYAGNTDPIYDGGKVYEPGREPNNPSMATVTVKRIVAGQIVEFTSTARWKEYFPGEKKGFMWKKMPYLMLAKVAEALALRKAFPNDLSGVKTQDEMTKFEVPVDVLPEPDNNNIKDTKKPAPEVKSKKVDNDKETVLKDGSSVIEGDFEGKEYYCCGCDIGISKSDKEFSEKVSVDGRGYCAECIKSYRK